LSNTLLTEYQEVLHRDHVSLPYTHEGIERLLDGLCLRDEKRRLGSRWWPVLSDPGMKCWFIWRLKLVWSILSLIMCGICSPPTGSGFAS
jgi:hypothetical protein